MGPTASGKTELGVRLVERHPFDIVSVDSALVYRGMDIGTAKPDAEVLRQAPHRLIDIREPEDTYSAGTFVRDARREIDAIHGEGRVPLLLGGTMLYFRSLIDGIAQLPDADAEVRREIDVEAERLGWPAMHGKLAEIDGEAAARIAPNDRQRIQRALEVYRVSGRPLSEWQRTETPEPEYAFIRIAVIPGSRAVLHTRIDKRFEEMLAQGFLEEVSGLRRRPGLDANSPSMRAVGYRQLWSHLDGECDLPTATSRGQAATRQLAKRQLTWLRGDSSLVVFDPLEDGVVETISAFLAAKLKE